MPLQGDSILRCRVESYTGRRYCRFQEAPATSCNVAGLARLFSAA